MKNVQENGEDRTRITLASALTRASPPQRPDLVAKAIVPDYALGAHTASLGLVFSEGTLFTKTLRGGFYRPAGLLESHPAEWL